LPERGTHTCATAPSVGQRGFPTENVDAKLSSMFEISGIGEIIKLVLEAAKDYRETRAHKVGISPLPLVALHESLRNLESTTRMLQKQMEEEAEPSSIATTVKSWQSRIDEVVFHIYRIDNEIVETE
jgi:hypothetical protein